MESMVPVMAKRAGSYGFRPQERYFGSYLLKIPGSMYLEPVEIYKPIVVFTTRGQDLPEKLKDGADHDYRFISR
jgi:hypothetical protein